MGFEPKVDRLRRLLDTLPQAAPNAPDPRIAGFARWARNYLATREARLTAEGLGRRFADEQLFGRDDDREFRPPRWY